jgi:uncharacterized protein
MSSNEALSSASDSESSNSGVASTWYTVVVLCLMLGISFLGAHFNLSGAFGAHGHVPMYLLVILTEWLTVALIRLGLRRRGLGLSDLVGGTWVRPVHILRDLGLGIAFFIIVGVLLLQGLTYLLKIDTPESLREMMPQTWFEMVLWVLMSLTAGFCEEVIFRGFLQRQFAALTRSIIGGILLQAIVFGLSHGYQGWKLMLLISIYGMCFGLLAQWRRSLRPGMFAHALEDALGGLAAFLGR